MENNKICIKIWDKNSKKFINDISIKNILNDFLEYDTNGIATINLENNKYKILRDISKKDKNNNQIFEGDILKGYIYPFMSGNKTWDVKEGEEPSFNYYLIINYDFDDGLFWGQAWASKDSSVTGLSNGTSYYLEDLNFKKFEIIGNIFENENLLKDYC